MDDNDDDLEEIRREAAARRANPAPAPARARNAIIPPARPPAHQQAYAAAAGGGGHPFPGGFANMLANAAGFGGHAFARPSASAFRMDFKAWSTSIHEAGEGRMERINGGRQNLMYGGNSALPTVYVSRCVTHRCRR